MSRPGSIISGIMAFVGGRPPPEPRVYPSDERLEIPQEKPEFSRTLPSSRSFPSERGRIPREMLPFERDAEPLHRSHRPVRERPKTEPVVHKKGVTFSPTDLLRNQIRSGNREVDWTGEVSSGNVTLRELIEIAARSSNLPVLTSLLEEATEDDIEYGKSLPGLTDEVHELFET